MDARIFPMAKVPYTHMPQEEAAVGEFPKSRIRTKREGLPFETKPCFSRERISLEEMVSALVDDLYILDAQTSAYNRFGEKYLASSRRLEKLNGYLGSCALTMAVLEKQGQTFCYYSQDIINYLFGCASYHFRKTHDAVGKTTVKNCDFWFSMVDMELRWFVLVQRLEATEKKMKAIRSGEISPESFLKERKPADPERSGKKQNRDPRPSNNPASFSVIKEALTESKNESAEPGAQPGLPEPKDEPMPVMPAQKKEPVPVFSPQKERIINELVQEYRAKAEQIKKERMAQAQSQTKDPPHPPGKKKKR